jgi:hypothetical protein
MSSQHFDTNRYYDKCCRTCIHANHDASRCLREHKDWRNSMDAPVTKQRACCEHFEVIPFHAGKLPLVNIGSKKHPNYVEVR